MGNFRAKGAATFAAAAILGLVAATYYIPQHLDWRLLWVVVAVLLVVFLGALGYGLQGHVGGIIIDNRNRVSLSKFQMTAWTVVVFACLITAAAVNIAGWDNPAAQPVGAAPPPAPLDIHIPAVLLAAMGLAGLSMISTPLILNTKMSAEPKEEHLTKAVEQLGLNADQVSSSGLVFGRSDVVDAEWIDMFRGDDVSNAGGIDLSKVQNFLVTILLLGAYSADMLRLLGRGHVIASLPELSEGMAGLMAISHGAYLTFKAVPHGGPTDGDQKPAPADAPAAPAAPPVVAPNMQPVG